LCESPFLDILQDRRYWVIHLITIASLFLGGVISINTGFVYKLFGVANFNQYFYNDNTQINLINDRFSILNEIEEFENEFCAKAALKFDFAGFRPIFRKTWPYPRIPSVFLNPSYSSMLVP